MCLGGVLAGLLRRQNCFSATVWLKRPTGIFHATTDVNLLSLATRMQPKIGNTGAVDAPGSSEDR